MPAHATFPNVFAIGLLAASGFASASAQTPTVERIESVDLRPGHAATATAFGKDFKDVLNLWTPVGNLPFKPEEGKPNETVAHFAGTLPASVLPGVYESRVIAAHGVSARQFLVVDDLPTFSAPDAAEVDPPSTTLPVVCCLNGQMNAIKPKFFGLELKKDQTVSIEVFARRLDSPLDPVLRFKNAEGKELAFADDTPGLAGDAQLRITAPEDGTYTLELRDVQYSGSGRHFFHLRIGDFPLIRGTFPGRTSADSEAGLATSTTNDLQAATAGIETFLTAASSFRTDHGSSIASIGVTPTPPSVEQEPNDTRDTANVIEPTSTSIAGRLQNAGDVDWFRITADANEHLCITTHTRDLGSPADVVLELHDASGKKLQESDDAGSNDAQLSLKLPAAGDYFVAVRELSGQGGPVWTYDLDVNYGGRIEVSTTIDTVAIPKVGTTAVPVAVNRLGFTGDIELQAVDLPPGVVSTPVMVSAKQKTAIVALHATADAPDTFQQRFRLRARADNAAIDLPVLYRPAAPKNNEVSHVLPRLQTGTFAVGVGAAQFTLTAEAATVMVARGGEAKVTIKATRTGEWTEPIDVASVIPAAELPDGFTIDTAKIEKDSGVITIKADENAKPGRYSISLQGTLKKDKTTINQPVPTISVIVTETKS